MPYTLPRIAINDIDKKAEQSIVEKKDITKIQLKDELRNELVTRELFEERFKLIHNEIVSSKESIQQQINMLNFKLNIFIIIALIGLAFANPSFVELLQKLLGLK